MCVALTVAVVLLATIVPTSVVPDTLSVDDSRRLVAESAIRSILVQGLAGLVIVVGLGLTARSHYISHQTHLTDRLTKAVEQLGHEKAAVRLGGAYSLQRLAGDSRDDKAMVADVLTGYLRVHAGTGSEPPPNGRISPDVQTALTVLLEVRS